MSETISTEADFAKKVEVESRVKSWVGVTDDSADTGRVVYLIADEDSSVSVAVLETKVDIS